MSQHFVPDYSDALDGALMKFVVNLARSLHDHNAVSGYTFGDVPVLYQGEHVGFIIFSSTDPTWEFCPAMEATR